MFNKKQYQKINSQKKFFNVLNKNKNTSKNKYFKNYQETSNKKVFFKKYERYNKKFFLTKYIYYTYHKTNQNTYLNFIIFNYFNNKCFFYDVKNKNTNILQYKMSNIQNIFDKKGFHTHLNVFYNRSKCDTNQKCDSVNLILNHKELNNKMFLKNNLNTYLISLKRKNKEKFKLENTIEIHKSKNYVFAPSTKIVLPNFVPSLVFFMNNNWKRTHYYFFGKGAAGGHMAKNKSFAPTTKII